MTNSQLGKGGAISVGDEHWYAPGEKDPASGRPIKSIIYQTNDFIVTIDRKNELNWSSKQDLDYAPDFGEIESRVSLSENLVERLFWRKNTFSYKRMLGGVMVRLLADKNSDSAKSMLNEINDRIYEHGKESVRMAYIYSALFGLAFSAIGLIFIALWGLKFSQQLQSGNPIYETALCVFLGGIGAFISTFFRFKNYSGSLIAGNPIHRLDGTLRIVYGMVAGLFLSFAVKGNILAGFAYQENSGRWILYFLAMVAGASEVLIPNLIKQSEEQVGIKPEKDNETNQDAQIKSDGSVSNNSIIVENQLSEGEDTIHNDNEGIKDTDTGSNHHEQKMPTHDK